MSFKKNPILGCAIGLSMLGVTPALATVSVTVDGSACPSCFSTNGSGQYQVLVTAGAVPVVVSATAGETFAYIHIVCSDDEGVTTLDVTGNATNIFETLRFGASVGALYIESITAGSVGSVTANRIGTVTATSGNIYDDVTQLSSVLIDSGDPGISLLRSVSGDITGNISATRRIETIDASDGSIGSSGTPVTISSGTSIGSIEAEEVFAAISISGGAADLDSLETTVGDFVGSLSCRKITGATVGDSYGLRVKGDLDADITQTAGMDCDFIVGDSLTSTSEISLPTNGLTKQIIFNANNNASDWDGTITINEAALTSQPYYTNTAASIGGGAAGLATFHLHDESCDPVNEAEVIGKRPSIICIGEEDCCLVFSKAYLRLYGPVSLHSTLPSVTVKKWNGSSWVAVGWTPVTTHPTSDHRVVEVKRVGGFWDLGDYLIEPISGRMLSEDVTGTPNVDDFDYTITLYDACESELGFVAGGYDMNSDGFMTSADLTAWVGWPRDLNADNEVDEFDLARLTVIVSYFSN